MMNNYVINPAVTGMYDYFEATTNYRNQWVGITDAPRTYILNVHGPHKFKNYGLGGAIYADVTGPTSRTGIAFSYAYHFQLNEKQKISLGLSGGLLQFKVDGTKITLLDQGDLVLTNTLMSTIVPDFGFGAYWYEKEKFYLGVSVPQFIQNRLQFFDNSTQTLSKLTAHYFINGGYNFTLNEKFSIEPSLLIKYADPVRAQFDIGTKVMYDKMVYLGGVFRTEDAFSILVGYVTPDQKFSFGYAYDITMSNISNYSGGSHEIMITARFGNIKSKSGSGSKSKKLSKLEKLEQKLKELDEKEEELDEELESEEDQTDQNKSKELNNDDWKKEIEKELSELETKDRALRAKVRKLREQAKDAGFDSPNDANFPGQKEYLDALDEIKAIYSRKQELDKLLDK